MTRTVFGRPRISPRSSSRSSRKCPVCTAFVRLKALEPRNIGVLHQVQEVGYSPKNTYANITPSMVLPIADDWCCCTIPNCRCGNDRCERQCHTVTVVMPPHAYGSVPRQRAGPIFEEPAGALYLTSQPTLPQKNPGDTVILPSRWAGCAGGPYNIEPQTWCMSFMSLSTQ
jgi:hypothetical protein